MLLGTGAALVGPRGFGPKTDFSTRATPQSVAIGDLNGDGKPDLAVTNYGSNTVSVLLALETTRTVLAVSPNPCVLGSPLTLTASVTVPVPGSGSPAGTVSFFDGTTLLGTSPVNGGQAGLALFAPYLGSRTVSAVYSGDGKLLGSIAASQTERVVATAQATITNVRDVPNDHGRLVDVRFTPSGFDYAGPGATVTGYELYRKTGFTPFTLSPATAASHGAPPPRGKASPSGIQLDGWDYLAAAPAHGESAYDLAALTVADSSSLGPHLATFMVRAVTASPSTFYDSAPDSGYSVDNLAAATPSPFVAAYVSGATHLHWGSNSEPDFWYYNLYRGSSAGFVPTGANRIASQSDTGFVDAGPAGSYYKLAAANLSGIESGYALVTPAGTTGVEGATLPEVVFLAPPRPNPSSGGTVLRFGLPRDAEVSLGIHDVHGRLMRELASGPRAAGEHQLAWDLRDGSGVAVGRGVYFVRLTVDGITRSERIAVIR